MPSGISPKTIGAIASLTLVALVAAAYVFMAPSTLTPEQLRAQGLYVLDAPKPLNDFSLMDQAGQPFTQDQLRGRWTLMFFGFTSCPDVCPTTMASISRFHQQLREQDAEVAAQLQVVLASVDPKRDTAEKLAAYVQYFGKDYLGVTGEFGELFKLTRQLNLSFGYLPGKSEDDYEVSHSSEIVLINPRGEHHGYFKAPADPTLMLTAFQSIAAQ